MTDIAIRALTPDEAVARREALGELFIDAVEGGASINFVWPMTRAKADGWWAGALESHARGERVILVAEEAGALVGSVQLVPAPQENQPHRADIAKMLVHRSARRRGVGAALMHAAEDAARALGRTLLTLDTESGSEAERLYARMGWVKFGEVPGFALTAEGSKAVAASFFYKEISSERG